MHCACILERHQQKLVFVDAEVWRQQRDSLAAMTAWVASGEAMFVLVGDLHDVDLAAALDEGVAFAVHEPEPSEHTALACLRAFNAMQNALSDRKRTALLRRYEVERDELLGIARAMSSERDLTKLFGLILDKSRAVTGADAASLYVVEDAHLHFKLAQNASVSYDPEEFRVPLSAHSIAGAAALHRTAINIADAYQLPAQSPFRFDRRLDEKLGYRTKSVLAVPLISQQNEVIGVIQLINKKRDGKAVLRTVADVNAHVVAFDAHSEQLLSLVAAQASASLESASLYQDVRSLLDGFVKASVEAIESRDPTTSGHSRRVASLTVRLAKAVHGETS